MPSSGRLDFHGIIGRSAAMQAIFRRIERGAPIDVPVLIAARQARARSLPGVALLQLERRLGFHQESTAS
jgi:hypothetical protein